MNRHHMAFVLLLLAVAGIAAVPPPVDGIEVQPVDETSTRLITTWNPSPGGVSYNVYRSSSDFTDVTGRKPVWTTTDTSYTSHSLLSEQLYYTAVTAVDESGAENTQVITVAARTGDNTPPHKVLDLQVNPVLGTTNLNLTWGANTDSDFDHFEIYRSARPFVEIDKAAQIGMTKEVRYTDGNLEEDKRYWYAVAAVDRLGNVDDTVVPTAGTPTVDGVMPFQPTLEQPEFLQGKLPSPSQLPAKPERAQYTPFLIVAFNLLGIMLVLLFLRKTMP